MKWVSVTPTVNIAYSVSGIFATSPNQNIVKKFIAKQGES